MVKRLLLVNPFRETLGGSYCGPASLKIVLDYYGIEKSEAELAKMCRLDKKLGVSDQALVKVAKGLGFKAEVRNNASFKDIEIWLNKKVPLIVNWFTRGRYDYPEDAVAEGHYSVVTGLDNEFIYLQDPEVGRIRKIARNDFFKVWFDYSTEYIKKWENMIIRQLIVIYR